MAGTPVDAEACSSLVLLDHCFIFLCKHLQHWSSGLRLYHPVPTPVAVLYTLLCPFPHFLKISGSLPLSLSSTYSCHNSCWFKYLRRWCFPHRVSVSSIPLSDHHLISFELTYSRTLTLASFQLSWHLLLLILPHLFLSLRPLTSSLPSLSSLLVMVHYNYQQLEYNMTLGLSALSFSVLLTQQNLSLTHLTFHLFYTFTDLYGRTVSHKSASRTYLTFMTTVFK